MSTEFKPTPSIEWARFRELEPPLPLRFEERKNIYTREGKLLFDESNERYIWCYETEAGTVEFEVFGRNQDKAGDETLGRVAKWLGVMLTEEHGCYTIV